MIGSFSRSILKSASRILKCRLVAVRAFHVTQTAYEGYSLAYSPNAKLSKSINDRYMCLPIPECKCQVTYVWIDGTGENVRCKTRTLDYVPQTYKDIPNWSYDGSSSYQASGANSDVYLCPCAMYNDPVTRGCNKLVLCETYTTDHKPTKTNHRAECVETLNKICTEEPLFGFEQEFYMLDLDQRPYGWPSMRGYPKPPGMYYCGVGASKQYGRDIIECHYRACLYAGVNLYGTNAEVSLAQWEFQVGTADGAKTADDLWIARYLMHRIAEDFGVVISFDPKPMQGWSGSGCHTNVSTKDMRCDGGIQAIEQAICRLEKSHSEHIKVYDAKGGLDNKRRLTGRHESSFYDKFTSGVASREASVRIPTIVKEMKKGFLEDRRPAANCDPYSVINILVKTLLLFDDGKPPPPTCK